MTTASDSTPTPTPTPSTDIYDALERFSEEEIPKLLAQLADVSSAGGVKKISHACTACGKREVIEVPVADMKDVRDTVALITSIDLKQRQLAKGAAPDDASKGARATLEEIREMSDEALAELVVRLEAEAAASVEA